MPCRAPPRPRRPSSPRLRPPRPDLPCRAPRPTLPCPATPALFSFPFQSTLLNLISGRLEATSGTITRNPRVRLATFSQHHVDGLDLALTPLNVRVRGLGV